MGTLTPEQRQKNMSAIRSKDTSIELSWRKALWNHGYRYRKNYALLPGKPDIAITKYRIAIFCDSEFFHGKGYEGNYDSRKYKSLKEQLEHSTCPEFWIKKITGNMKRDEEINKELECLGWRVLRFWSKDVLRNTDECVKTIEETIFAEKIEE